MSGLKLYEISEELMTLVDRIIHMLGKLRHCRHIVKLGFIRRSKETDNPFRDIVREILHTCISRSDFTSFISCAVLSFLFFGNHKPHEELMTLEDMLYDDTVDQETHSP